MELTNVYVYGQRQSRSSGASAEHQRRFAPQVWPAKLIAYREELRRAVTAIDERRRRRMRA